jgi:hypothetical protein
MGSLLPAGTGKIDELKKLLVVFPADLRLNN